MPVDRIKLSKTMSHALRHEPWLYELELDEEGWTPVNVLLEALHESRPDWSDLGVSDVEEVIAKQDKKRFEMQGDRIRALYGHSIPARIRKIPAEPPELLYHGTSSRTAPLILESGLQPMQRQYVHLSVDEHTALQVALRKRGRPVLLRVMAREAFANGIQFYEGNELIWLADPVPSRFIHAPETP